MGQIFSDLIYRRRSSPTSTPDPEPADPSTQSEVPEPELVTSSSQVPGLATASSSLLNASKESTATSTTEVTNPKITRTSPQQPTPDPDKVLNRSPKTEEFIRCYDEFVRIMLNARNNCYGDTYVDASYSEERMIKNAILEELPYVNITRVCVVKNSYLLGMYELKRAEYQSRYGPRVIKELRMFHATDANNVDSIIQDNLDWRRVYRNKWGVGVCFSKDPDYCNFYCTPRNGSRRVFIVAQVLVCWQTYGDYSMVIPPDHYDTTVDSRNLVCVKFNDNEFIPKYLVFYDAPPRNRSKHWINYPRRW